MIVLGCCAHSNHGFWPALLPYFGNLGLTLSMSSQDVGLSKQKRRVSSKLVDASVLKQGIEQHGMAAGSAKNYDAMLAQADNWLPCQLEKLIKEQAAHREALQTPTEPLPAELTCPSGEVIPVDGSAKYAFQQPMECTRHLIALFEWSKCVETGVTSEGATQTPAGASVLKTIHAAFIRQFELL
jgi:hypothetical protein